MRENNIEKIWPRWKVDSVLGKGSFGTVYKVVRKTFDQTFYAAVKCIHIPEDESQIREMQSDGLSRQEVSDYYKEAIQGLAGEISIMESLKGASNIVSIEDYEIEPDEKGIGWDIYIRMELLENLNTFRQHNDMSPAQTVQMGIDICTALEYCSRKNIIHRDIKPDNIFVSQFGQFKLGDFGIARHLEGTRATMSQKGTSTYMAPEIFRGERYDATVDTYSLGLVLYRLVNGGRMPFMPPSPAPIRYADMEAATNQRLSGCVLPPPSGCDSQLAEIVCRAAHPDPAMRYKGPTDMKEALEQWLAVQHQEIADRGNLHSQINSYTSETAQAEPLKPEKTGTEQINTQSFQESLGDDDRTIFMFDYENPGAYNQRGELDKNANADKRVEDNMQKSSMSQPEVRQIAASAANVSPQNDETPVLPKQPNVPVRNLKKAEEKMISFAKNTAFILCMFACGFAGLALLLMLLEVLF